MTSPAIPTAARELTGDEGYVRTPRLDTMSRWFCGVGCDLKAHGLVKPNGAPLSMAPWSDALILEQLDKDIATAAMHLALGAPWTGQLDPVRARVLLNMCFNMGWRTPDGKHGLSTFGPTLALIKAGHYPEAAAHMLASQWAKQVGRRAARLAARMATGDYYTPWEPGEILAATNLLPFKPVAPFSAATPDAQESPSILDRILTFIRNL